MTKYLRITTTSLACSLYPDVTGPHLGEGLNGVHIGDEQGAFDPANAGILIMK